MLEPQNEHLVRDFLQFSHFVDLCSFKIDAFLWFKNPNLGFARLACKSRKTSKFAGSPTLLQPRPPLCKHDAHLATYIWTCATCRMVQLKHVAVRRTLTCPPRGGAPKNNCSSFSFQGTGTQKSLYTYLYDPLWFISFATKTPPENQLKTQHLSRKRKGQNQSVVDFLPKKITQPQQAAAHF